MKFIEIRPLRLRNTSKIAEETIKVSFAKLKTKREKYVFNCYIGNKIAESLKLKPKDKVTVFYSDENDHTLLIKKGEHHGYMLKPLKNSLHFKVTKWDIFVPGPDELRPQIVKMEGGAEINYLNEGINMCLTNAIIIYI